MEWTGREATGAQLNGVWMHTIQLGCGGQARVLLKRHLLVSVSWSWKWVNPQAGCQNQILWRMPLRGWHNGWTAQRLCRHRSCAPKRTN